jgi:hypothetical protein
MPTVAAMLVDAAARRLATEQIGALATIRFCDTFETLARLIAGGELNAIVTDLCDASGASFLPAAAAIHAQAPRLPVILFCAPTPAALRDIPDIMSLARGFHVVLRNHEHLGLALRPLLEAPRVPSAAETLVRHLVPIVPGPFRPFFIVSALKASPNLHVSMAARWSGISRRNLERALRQAHLPGAGVTLGSCTALHAAWWLDVHGWTAKQVVAEMQFSHTTAVSRVLQRYFGASIRALRAEGGFQELLSRFESTLLDGPGRARRA